MSRQRVRYRYVGYFVHINAVHRAIIEVLLIRDMHVGVSDGDVVGTLQKIQMG